MNLNLNFKKLEKNYVFVEVENKIREYEANNPKAEVIRLGVGDVTKPLCSESIKAMHKAVDEMGKFETFKSYGPSEGYEFLRKEISKYYLKFNIKFNISEIFINDGINTDLWSILDLFSKENTVLIPDPVYPVYSDVNIIDGRKIIYLNSNKENNFLPLPDKKIKPNIIYMCSPNNPTGTVYNRKELKIWVDYALENDAVILFDSAYECFIDDQNTDDLPKSIFEIENSKKCCIEFCSFSKKAGFTGIRCGYTTIPKELKKDNFNLREIWHRRVSVKSNGVSYISQRGAQSIFTQEGESQTKFNINYYKENSKIICDNLKFLNIWHVGGKYSPYIWLKCPKNMKSWEFFDYLLNNFGIAGIPGSGFGKNGENFFRFTGFGEREKIIKFCDRTKKVFFEKWSK
ncbi:MAG: LL-diaminopimelate aminotransferase [Candidatus Paraimprobicoccus trichonymphae]|uniref:LL-diaminopimelate aminotransferase n=1 Tax=Candidatus Paraimprobicoccus trichonymphae TaxID=3033793 RepID=A0AA48KXL9_9FIRM|nr:MAG: LL-diaminopimelate aminotransferase [Candidatus Paraimprobicoccus trichonymphae]